MTTVNEVLTNHKKNIMKILIPVSGIPPTKGHYQLIGKAMNLYPQASVIYLGIFKNPAKSNLHDILSFADYIVCRNKSKTLQQIVNGDRKDKTGDRKNHSDHDTTCRIAIVKPDNQSVIDFCKDNQIDVIIRGSRNVKDWLYECGVSLGYIANMLWRWYFMKILIVWSDVDLCDISSTALRQALTTGGGTEGVAASDVVKKTLADYYDVPIEIIEKLQRALCANDSRDAGSRA